jgi:hypothetical protein
LSFELAFTKLADQWFVQIVPSWYYSWNGHKQSNWHDQLLSQQKRLEHNSTVKNMVRFVAFFLSKLEEREDVEGLRFLSLVEFNVHSPGSFAVGCVKIGRHESGCRSDLVGRAGVRWRRCSGVYGMSRSWTCPNVW